MDRFPTYAVAAVMASFFATQSLAQDEEAAPSVVRPAKVSTVQVNDNSLRRTYPAIVQPAQEAELSFRVSGQVISLPARAAMQLQEGEEIAALDKRTFQTAVDVLQSQVDQAEAELAALRKGAREEEIIALQAAVAAAQATVDQITDQAARTRQLFDRGVVSQANLDADEAELRVAQANLQTTKEELAIGLAGGREEDIAASEARLRGLVADLENAQDDLGDATLRAPFDGTVSRRDIDNFTTVQAGQSIVLFQEIATVHLAFDVPGSDVLAVSARSEELQLTADIIGGPQGLENIDLVEFSTQADAGTQTYRARIAVEVPEGAQILPGMVARVHVLLQNAFTTVPITVPLTALGANPDGSPFVWVVDPATNAVSPRNLMLGAVSDAKVGVIDGVAEGETIVVAGVSQLRDGQVIRPITEVGD